MNYHPEDAQAACDLGWKIVQEVCEEWDGVSTYELLKAIVARTGESNLVIVDGGAAPRSGRAKEICDGLGRLFGHCAAAPIARRLLEKPSV